MYISSWFFLVLCLPRQVRTSNGAIHHDPQLSPSTCCNPLSALFCTLYIAIILKCLKTICLHENGHLSYNFQNKTSNLKILLVIIKLFELVILVHKYTYRPISNNVHVMYTCAIYNVIMVWRPSSS